jgi:hypothetical protein
MRDDVVYVLYRVGCVRPEKRPDDYPDDTIDSIYYSKGAAVHALMLKYEAANTHDRPWRWGNAEHTKVYVDGLDSPYYNALEVREYKVN